MLDLAHHDAWDYLLDVTGRTHHALRRRLPQVGPQPGAARGGRQTADGVDRPGVHAQVEAVYRLHRRAQGPPPRAWRSRAAPAAAPASTSASSPVPTGCGRPTATTRWSARPSSAGRAQLLPPELVGTHVGGPHSHTSGRVTSESFRYLTALFGHAGIEDDLTTCTPQELAGLKAWAALYKELRPLLHSGRVVRADLADDATLLHGVVAADASHAVYCWVRLATSTKAQSGRVKLPGLPARGRYRVRIRTEAGLPSLHQVSGPAWFTAALDGWVPLPGSVLGGAGLPLPTLNPGQALLIEVAAA